MDNEKNRLKNEFKKKLYTFILELIKLIDTLPKNDPTCRVVSEQVIDSGTGMLSNYIEAQSASSKKDFINYFHHCLKCCNETKVWITILRDSNKINLIKANELLGDLKVIGDIFGSSLITLKNK